MWYAGHGKSVEGWTKEEGTHLPPADHCEEHDNNCSNWFHDTYMAIDAEWFWH